MRPAAYMRSSTSTVSGKKSKCSFGCFDAVVAESNMVSSSRYATTAPAACLASLPVSKRMVRVPNRPLSITASVSCTVTPVESVIWCISSLVLGLRRAGRPLVSPPFGERPRTRPVFDRSARDHFPGATTEDRRTCPRALVRSPYRVFFGTWTEGERPAVTPPQVQAIGGGRAAGSGTGSAPREWWSCLCSLRCSVRPTMRLVSSATWASGDPVSESCTPYSVRIDFLSSVDRATGVLLFLPDVRVNDTDSAGRPPAYPRSPVTSL